MPLSKLIAVCAWSAALATGTQALSDPAGAYLAARVAAQSSDYETASKYFDQLMAGGMQDAATLETALINHVILQDFDRTTALVDQLVAAAGDDGSQIAALVQLATVAKQGDFAAGLTLVEDGANAGPLVLGLYKAWALVGEGRMAEALEAFDAMAKQPALAGFASYHKALALAQVGDFEGAEEILAGPAADVIHRSRRGVLAHVQVLSQLERNDEALQVMAAVFGDTLDPHLLQVREQLTDGEALPFTVARNATDGIAELYFTVATALAGEVPDAFPLVHTRLAHWLRPDHEDAILLSASLLEEQKQFDLAIATYQEILPESPLFQAAEMGRAEAMVRADRTDAAIEVLQSLARAEEDSPGVWTSLGDVLRREERYDEATKAYDSAIEAIPDPQAADWFVFYARAISEERADHWDAAEADFRRALDLNPGQPSVLNYLGYSYVEKKQNLDEALGMIEQAVAARPDSGYIVDSLGWAYFELGRYQESVEQMERAVELEAVDPLVNDHLGDVYWAVGRKREAEFQWKRALSFAAAVDNKTDMDIERVRRKLEVGLDVVREEEGAPPLSAVKREVMDEAAQ
ncbi:hypothetical protein BFP70_13645 [Thioclava sp. SK-1]|nr:hypothetical protein BFP70_13645 [Thioclava sp. SK-1]